MAATLCFVHAEIDFSSITCLSLAPPAAVLSVLTGLSSTLVVAWKVTVPVMAVAITSFPQVLLLAETYELLWASMGYLHQWYHQSCLTVRTPKSSIFYESQLISQSCRINIYILRLLIFSLFSSFTILYFIFL